MNKSKGCRNDDSNFGKTGLEKLDRRRKVLSETGSAMTNPVISPDGKKRWYDENGLRHRVDGPAIEWSNGDKWWMRHGNFHRVDGPAIEHSTMMRTFLDEEWYVNGEPIDIKPILERLDVSPDWRNWTDEEKFLVRLACAPMISDTESKRITNL